MRKERMLSCDARSWSRRWWPIGLLMLAAPAAAQPQWQAIPPAAIATAAGHPGPLRIEPESTSELSKGFGAPVWAVGVDSADGSFGHVSVLLVHRGSFLTDAMTQSLAASAAAPTETAAALRADLQGQVDRAHDARERTRLQGQLQELDAIAARGPITQRLALAGGRVGYGTMLGYSASGATFVTALPSPDDRYELLVATGASLEGEHRTPTAASAAYERAMHERPLPTSEAIALAIYAALFPARETGPTPQGRGAADEGRKMNDEGSGK